MHRVGFPTGSSRVGWPSAWVSFRSSRLVLAWVAVVLAHAGPAAAQPFEVVGARALGMAGAFTAVADDASAVYWNPAGFVVGPLGSVVVGRDLVVDETSGRAAPRPRHSATLLALGSPSAGLAYYRLKHHGPPALAPALEPDRRGGQTVLVTHQAALAFAHQVAAPLLVGAAVRFVRGAVSQLGEPSGRASEVVTGNARHVLDVDLGFLLRMGPVRLGLVARNLREPHFLGPAGGSSRLARRVRAGIAVQPTGRLVVAGDVDLANGERRPRRAAAGVEVWLGTRAAVRGGLQVVVKRAEGESPARRGPSLGGSLGLTRTVWLDGHWTGVRAGDQDTWGWALRLAF